MKQVREHLATYRAAEDLINIGAYVAGSNPKIDEAIRYIEPIIHYLQQPMEEPSKYEDAIQRLSSLFEERGKDLPGRPKAVKGGGTRHAV